MNAVPLTDPTGTVRGWACRTCWNPGGFGKQMRPLDAHDIAAARSDAERCCTCSECDAPSPSGLLCNACETQRREANDRNALVPQPAMTMCLPCCGDGEITCKACNGRGEVPL
jgi:hypothetical protein